MKIWSGSIFGVLFVCLFVFLFDCRPLSVGRLVGRPGDLRIGGWGIFGDLGGMVDLPDIMVDLPVTLEDLPDTMVDLPGTMVDLPGTMVEIPDTMVDLPETW